MAVREATYALTRQVPYLLEQTSSAQTITAPIRHGSTGALQEPASGTCTITDPSGTEFASGAVVVSSSLASYDVPSTASGALGAGWDVVWALVMADGLTYTYPSSAYLCEYVPPSVISVLDLYTRMPELEARIPARWRDTNKGGDGSGWQPVIDDAYYELIQRLLDDGRKPWLIREVTGYREWLLTRTLYRCVQSMSYGPDSAMAQSAKELWHQWRAADGRLRLQYSDTEATRREAGSPVVRLCATGRPLW